MIVGIIIAGLLTYIVIKVFNSPRTNSYEYRKLLTNLYVAGKIKEIAKKDGIDLLKEYKDFNKLSHKKFRDIDNSIENNISEKIKKQIETTETK